MKKNCYQWYTVKQRTTPLFPYVTNKHINVDDVNDENNLAKFCVYKDDITRLVKAFRLPQNLFVKIKLQLQQKDYVCCCADLPIHVPIVTSSHNFEEVNLSFA